MFEGKARSGKGAWSSMPGVALTYHWERAGYDTWSGWIYAIAEDGTPLVKIGYTRFGTVERMKNIAYSIQGSVTLVGVVFVIDGVAKIERAVHRILQAQWIEGEWFYLHMNQNTLERLVGEAKKRLSI